MKKNSIARRTPRLWHALDGVLVLCDVHDRHARDLPDAPAQVLVARGHDVAPVHRHAPHQAVVRVRPLVVARQPHEAGVLGDLQRDAVLGPQLLQLRHHAVGDVRHALGVQAVHDAGDHLQLVGDAEVDEVGVQQHVVGGPQLLVVPEEQRAGSGGHADDLLFLALCLFGPGGGGGGGLSWKALLVSGVGHAVVLGAQQLFHHCKLAGFSCFSHIDMMIMIIFK